MKQSEFTGSMPLKKLVRQPKGTSCVYTLGEGFRASDFQPMAYSYAAKVGAKITFKTCNGSFENPVVQVKATVFKAATQKRLNKKRGAPKGVRASTLDMMKSVRLLLSQNYSQAAIGRELDCSREYVRQLVNKL